MASLLPPNATGLERDLETVANKATALPVPIPSLWDWETCPVDFLPWLAWTFSVADWDSNWSEDQKRQSIKESYEIHVKKGTVGSIRRVLRAAGYGEVIIVERASPILHNGSIRHNGEHRYQQKETNGFMYRVYLNTPISTKQAAQIRRLLAQTAPVRSHLAEIHYKDSLHLHNNTLRRNGEYTRGAV